MHLNYSGVPSSVLVKRYAVSIDLDALVKAGKKNF